MDKRSSEFASVERASSENLETVVKKVASHPLLQELLDSTGSILLILNRHRQIVAANDRFLRTMGYRSFEQAAGLRPGEALFCVNADKNPNGCGTSKSCSVCGIVQAILYSQKNNSRYKGESTVLLARNEPGNVLEFEVIASPFNPGGEDLTIVSLRDIRDSKNKERLERIFFHDILNTITGIAGWSKALLNADTADVPEISGHIHDLTNRLQQEVEYQRLLTYAEKGELSPRKEKISIGNLMHDLEIYFQKSIFADNRILSVPSSNTDTVIYTDRTLLGRVLLNMMKNACEAAPAKTEIRVWWEINDSNICFHVRNEGIIPPEVAMRIFQRSFSTKSESGRGYGTYSMKLLGERYLGGKVSFVSTLDTGTIFSICLPLNLQK